MFRKARPRHRRPVRRAAAVMITGMASSGVLAVTALGVFQSGLVPQRAHASLSASSYPAKKSPTRKFSRRKSPASVPDTRESTTAASGPPELTPAQRRACPAAAVACADLTAHLAWLQSGGRVTFGPVQMEPGPPGTRAATPTGTFHVQWKAGPGFVSNEFGDPMPWATFFAPGGVAFHGGSLTRHSHGCIHLSIAEAKYFQSHLAIGAEVVVF